LGKEFELNLPHELNFLNEGRNAERIKELHKNDKNVIIPKIYWDYCKPRVLVMSFEEGSSITDINYLKKNKIDVKDVSLLLSEIFYKQIFQFGFVHSDPHPGNIYIRKEKENGKEVTKIVLLDHGLYRDYDDHFRYNYCNLWRGL